MTKNKVAPKGQVWVCAICGKRSRDPYGNKWIDPGWDELCYFNSVLCYEKPNDDGTYTAVPDANTVAK